MKTVHRTALWAALGLVIIGFCAPALTAQPNGASPLGKTNFAGYYAEIPTLPTTVAEAARRVYGSDLLNPAPNALEQFYQPFSDKVERAQQAYQQYYGDRAQAWYGNQTEAGLRAQTAAQIDRNPVIAGMGGAENVAQMTPQQAEAAARQSAAAFTADPFAANGIQSAGMTALYQKIMNDPVYAGRFQQMSEKEREAELRKFMANDKPQAKTPAQMEQDNRRRQQQNQQANKVRAAMAFQQQLSALQGKIGEAQTRYARQRAELLAAPGNHQAIDAAYAKKYATIPLVELGEYGHDHDPAQVQQLKKETAAQHLQFATKVLAQDCILLAQLAAAYKSLAAEYVEFYTAHKQEINGNIADQMNGTETETMVAQFEAQLVALASDLVLQAKTATREAAFWEKNQLEL